jgi:heme exporter protein A
MEQNTLKIEGIYKRYGFINILKNINFVVTSGDILILIGPNGAGKTTLLKILSTQTQPSKGMLSYNSLPVYKNLNDYKQKISLVSHKSFLYDDLTAHQNLLFFAKMYNCSNSAQKVLELLDFFELGKRKDDPVKYYSRGMQQKLTIARSMINNSQFIYLDEPYTGLDTRAEGLLDNLILKKSHEGAIIVLVSHDIDKAYNICTKIILLKHGEVYFSGDKRDIPLVQVKKMHREILDQ